MVKSKTRIDQNIARIVGVGLSSKTTLQGICVGERLAPPQALELRVEV